MSDRRLKLCDDIEDPKRCLNPDLREEDRDWSMTDFMYAGDLGNANTPTPSSSIP